MDVISMEMNLNLHIHVKDSQGWYRLSALVHGVHQKKVKTYLPNECMAHTFNFLCLMVCFGTYTNAILVSFLTYRNS